MQTQLEISRRWEKGEAVFLIGPGGVGKSTLGAVLANRLNWPLVDLDLVFCAELDIIGDFIAEHGYARYRAENLALAERIATANAAPMVLVTSSGFLSAEPGTDDHKRARQLIGSGYSVSLLPSLDIEVATETVVARQLTRGFGFRSETEIPKFRARFAIYRSAADALVISTEPPRAIAAAVVLATGMMAKDCS